MSINRRDVIKAALGVPLVKTLPERYTDEASKDEPELEPRPKLIGCWVSCFGQASADTGLIDSTVAKQQMRRAAIDMGTILGQGRIYDSRYEPEWLTLAVERGMERWRKAREQRITDLKCRLDKFDDNL